MRLFRTRILSVPHTVLTLTLTSAGSKGFKVEISPFSGSSKPEELIDWLSQVDEMLDFKEVPSDRRVSVVTMRLTGRAQAWWQQLKQTRVRQGKPKITNWDKFKKRIKAAFLPFNFERELYQRFQNLRQGSRSVDEYSTEFYEFLARVDINETPVQLVSRYIGGLRIQLQDVLNMFDPLTVAEAHQRASQAEKQSARRGNTGFHPTQGSSAGPSSSTPGPTGPVSAPPPANPNSAPPRGYTAPPQGRSGPRGCFNCGAMGHRQADCPRPPSGNRGLFTDAVEFESTPIYDNPVYDDDIDDVAEEYVSGDVGPLLLLRRTFLSPRAPETEWLRNNLFHSTCTVSGKICTFIIDAGSCENVISEVAVSKLNLATEPHPKPYRLSWLSQGTDVMVSKRALVNFSIGPTYQDAIYCDVVPMDACHLLLGRPWQYDNTVQHDDRCNTYSFMFRGKKIVLVPTKPKASSCPAAPGDSPVPYFFPARHGGIWPRFCAACPALR